MNVKKIIVPYTKQIVIIFTEEEDSMSKIMTI